MLLFHPSRGNLKCTPGKITMIPLVCIPAASVRKDSRRGRQNTELPVRIQMILLTIPGSPWNVTGMRERH